MISATKTFYILEGKTAFDLKDMLSIQALNSHVGNAINPTACDCVCITLRDEFCGVTKLYHLTPKPVQLIESFLNEVKCEINLFSNG